MKKKVIGLIVCILLLGGLAFAYYTVSEQNKAKAVVEEEAKNEQRKQSDKSVQLIDKKIDDVASVTIKNPNETITFLPKMVKNDYTGDDERVFLIEGLEDFDLIRSSADDIVRLSYELYAAEKVMDEAENLADYGLEPIVATASFTYTDGTSMKINIGKITPTKEYYYCMVDGQKELYMIYQSAGSRVNNTLDSLINKTLPTIDVNGLQYIYMYEKGVNEIEFAYDGSDEQRVEEIQKYGGIPLVMKKPYPGREFYANSLDTDIIQKLGSVTLGMLVDAKPDDYAKYGLDDPQLKVIFEDNENSFGIEVGKQVDASTVYAKLPDKPYVFKTSVAPMAMFRNINPFFYVDRFVALINIETCTGITIDSDKLKSNITITTEKLPPEGDQQVGDTLIHAQVNGKDVQQGAFQKFYQTVIGLCYETEIKGFEKPSTPPEVTIVYTLTDNKPPIYERYYPYNADFYAVQRDDNPIQFVVSKRSINIMYQFMDDLLAGKLDQED